MLEIKAIETKYKGYNFRSRLEARWAVFFDTLGIKWEYEQEGFELGKHGRYLPDFYLPDYRTYVEVKPSIEAVAEAAQKLLAFEQLLLSTFVDNKITDCFIVIAGSPGDDSYFVYPTIAWCWSMVLSADGEMGNSVPLTHFASSRRCYKCLFMVDDWGNDFSLHHSECDEESCGDKTNRPHEDMESAYRAARSARFEHGESPFRKVPQFQYS